MDYTEHERQKERNIHFRGTWIPDQTHHYAPMKKVFGKWTIDINMNKLMLVVLGAFIHEPVALTPDELRFIRSYLEMTTTAFGKIFGVSHVAVLKWESGKKSVCLRKILYQQINNLS